MNAESPVTDMHDIELESWPKYTGRKTKTETSWPTTPDENLHDTAATPRPVKVANSWSIDSQSMVKTGVELYKAGKYEKALWSFQEAMKCQVLEYGEDQPIVAQTLANIGSVYLRQGRLLVAEEALTSALEIMEQARARCNSEEDRQQIAICDVLNNLGNLAYLEGSYMKSMQFYRQNLRELRRRDNVDGDLADTLHNIGRLHVIRREWDAASSILSQCRQVEEKMYGSKSPQIADTLELIGYVYFSQECYDNARISFSEALSIHQQHFGAINENVAIGLTNVAMVLGAQGNTDAAIQIYQAAKDVFRFIPGVSEKHRAYNVACRGLENLKARVRAEKWSHERLPVRAEGSPSLTEEPPKDERERFERRGADHLFERRDF